MVDINHDAITESQYQIIAARRQAYDTLIWQTPVISLTAQAFLFTIALGSGYISHRIIASALALITALASSQLLAKHRYHETYYSRLLEAIESCKRLPPVHQRPPKPNGPIAWSSYTVWQVVFIAFAVAAIGAGILAILHA